MAGGAPDEPPGDQPSHPQAAATSSRPGHPIRVIPRRADDRSVGRRVPNERKWAMGWLIGAIYVVLLITLGVISIRKGHWIMFILGLFVPLFWLIGALLPSRARMA
jgi:hypothetical protein